MILNRIFNRFCAIFPHLETRPVYNYNFPNCYTAELFMILIQSLKEPLISFGVPNKIFFNPNENLSG
jgi:hypothetical protein